MHIEVDFEDKTWQWDPDSVLLSEWLEIERVTGWERPEWYEKLSNDNILAIQSWLLLLRRRDGETDLRLADIDGRFSTFKVRQVADPGDELPSKSKAGRQKRPPLEAAS
jgi:hypothetical protein